MTITKHFIRRGLPRGAAGAQSPVSSRIQAKKHLCVCDTFQIMHKVGEKYHNAVLEVKGYKVISETGDYLPPRWNCDAMFYLAGQESQS